MADTRGSACFMASGARFLCLVPRRSPKASWGIAIYNVPVYDYIMTTSATREACG